MEACFQPAGVGTAKGDFADLIESAKIPNIIFYDPFSYKTDPALWTVETFSRIFDRCLDEPAELYTYSASTAVRGALLAAGFFVAQGIGTGPKSETTIAFTSERVARSSAVSSIVRAIMAQALATKWREISRNHERRRQISFRETHRKPSAIFRRIL